MNIDCSRITDASNSRFNFSNYNVILSFFAIINFFKLYTKIVRLFWVKLSNQFSTIGMNVFCLYFFQSSSYSRKIYKYIFFQKCTCQHFQLSTIYCRSIHLIWIKFGRRLTETNTLGHIENNRQNYLKNNRQNTARGPAYRGLFLVNDLQIVIQDRTHIVNQEITKTLRIMNKKIVRSYGLLKLQM